MFNQVCPDINSAIHSVAANRMHDAPIESLATTKSATHRLIG